jgi:hypothetical protein
VFLSIREKQKKQANKNKTEKKAFAKSRVTKKIHNQYQHNKKTSRLRLNHFHPGNIARKHFLITSILFLELPLVQALNAKWCRKRSFPHKGDLTVCIELSEKKVGLYLVLSINPQQKTTILCPQLTGVFVRYSPCASNTKLKLISKQSKAKYFCIFGFNNN